MKLITILFLVCLSFACMQQQPVKIFDAHLHGDKDPVSQLAKLEKAGVYGAAISSSWDLQNKYRGASKMKLLYGLMFPCPNGKVPYSNQPCFDNGADWPSPAWVEQQIKDGKIDFFGEVLSQYYGISSSDSLLLPYFSLAQKYKLPVGVHTGGAGPNHGSPNFKMEMGDPNLLKPMLSRFPDIKWWIMHAGDQHYKETIALMQSHKNLYADLSVISDPDLPPFQDFPAIMKALIDAGLEDRILFGTDNGDIGKIVAAFESLDFLSAAQKEKIYYKNAERFFGLVAN